MVSTKEQQRLGLKKLSESNSEFILGIDECGTGAWAGLFTVTSVVARRGWKPVKDIKDSKRLSKNKREKLVDDYLLPPEIEEATISHVMQHEFDMEGVGIRKALHKAIESLMLTAVDKYGPITVVVDGLYAPVCGPVTSIAFPAADDLVPACSAASIIGKVSRDRIMLALHDKYPDYGFNKNMGYGTKAHRKAIEKLGITPIHRRTFAPIKEFLRTERAGV